MLNIIKRIIVLFVLTIVTISNLTFSLNAQINLAEDDSIPNINITTPSAILIDAKTGNILFEKNSHQKMYPASITKIMTAILALENGDLNSTVKMSYKAVMSIEPGSSNAGLNADEELTLEQILYALLLWSANEGANAIAEEIGDTNENFAQMMTNRAKEIGATDTNFVNPHGLHDENHYTTAYDMSMIFKHAITIPKFREVISTLTYTIPPTNKNPKEKELTNSNKLIRTDSNYYYENAIGGKTGYTTKAGSTLVSVSEKDGMELICVVLNSPIEGYNSYSFIDSRNLFEYGFENFENLALVAKGEKLEVQNVIGSKETITPFYENEFNITLPKGVKKENIVFEKHINELEVPVNKNQLIGHVLLKYEGQEIGKINILSDKDILKKSLSIVIKDGFIKAFKILIVILKYAFIIIAAVFVFLVVLTIIYNKRRNYKRRKLK